MKIINTIKNLFFWKDTKKQESKDSEKTVAKSAIKKAETKKTTAKTVKAKKTKVLDFFKFTAGDKDTRYFLTGVYHEEGFKIATNGRILVMVKSDYEEKFEKVILHKTLIPIEGTFPNYKRIIPDFSKMHLVEFNLDELKNSIKEIEGVIKIAKKENKKEPYIYKMPNGGFLSFENLQRMIHFLECYPDFKMYAYDDNSKMLAFVSGNIDSYNALLLVMPLTSYTIEESTRYIGNFGFKNLLKTEMDILKDCKQLNILKRKDYGTMTEKDLQFLDDLQKYMAIFKNEDVA